jgi:hypothetical protein
MTYMNSIVSGKPVGRLPVMSSVEEILGVTSTDISYPGSGPTSSLERPAVFVTKEDTRPSHEKSRITLNHHDASRRKHER